MASGVSELSKTRVILMARASATDTPVMIDGTSANGLEVDVTRVTGNVTVVQPTHDSLNGNANPVPVTLIPTSDADRVPTLYSSAAYEDGEAVKVTAGTLYSLTVYNSGAAAQWIQVHNAAAVPANGAIPSVSVKVPADSNISVDFGPFGVRFGTGIAVCNSSTGPTKTLGAADCFFMVAYK